MEVVKNKVSENSFSFAWSGFYCLYEKNPLAPGWRLTMMDSLWGISYLTPLSPLWFVSLNNYLKWAKLGDMGETSEAIAQKLQELLDDEANSFYSQVKIHSRDYYELAALPRKNLHFVPTYS